MIELKDLVHGKKDIWLMLFFAEKITGEVKQKRRKSKEKRNSKKKKSGYHSEIFSVVLAAT